MKKYEYPIFYFCNGQKNFILFLIMLHIVEPIRMTHIVHPLTNQVDGKIQYIRTWPWLNKIINVIICLLLSKEGEERMMRLRNAGVINVDFQ